jgi:hypothetical protein
MNPAEQVAQADTMAFIGRMPGVAVSPGVKMCRLYTRWEARPRRNIGAQPRPFMRYLARHGLLVDLHGRIYTNQKLDTINTRLDDLWVEHRHIQMTVHTAAARANCRMIFSILMAAIQDLLAAARAAPPGSE